MNAWKRSNRAGVYARQKETAPKGGWMGAEILNRFEQPYYADRCDPFIIVLPPGKTYFFFLDGQECFGIPAVYIAGSMPENDFPRVGST